MHEGHRQRMIEKLMKSSELPDHEILEILLFNAIPRKNTNEIAHSLLLACGNLGNVFHTSPEVLASVEGVGPGTAAYLQTIGIILDRIEAENKLSAPLISFTYHGFSDYVMERYRGIESEIIEFYAIDSKEKITYVASYSSSNEKMAEVGVAEVTRFIADHHPHGLAVSHNHPGGSRMPSIQDHEFTRLLQVLCSVNNVRLVEHVIIGKDGPFSYFLSGDLTKITEAYSVTNLMRKMHV